MLPLDWETHESRAPACPDHAGSPALSRESEAQNKYVPHSGWIKKFLESPLAWIQECRKDPS